MEEIPEWFHECKFNYAENLLQFKDNRIALYLTGERQKEVKTVTYFELNQKVALYASALKYLGIRKGDCVVGYLPNGEEAVEAMLAASSIGAIWSSTSPDFGISSVLDRFRQIQPKVIFSVDKVVYNRKVHNHLEKLHEVVLGLPLLKKVVIVPFDIQNKNEIAKIPKSCFLDEFLETGKDEKGNVPELEFVQLPFNHPLFILYSSGTTGVPKCIVHSSGGTLIQHLKEHLLHGNMSRSDVIMYYTTTGWMMWNWLISCLAIGCSVVLYDGSPFVPHDAIIWDLVDLIGITILGTSAKGLAVMESKGIKPKFTHSLESLHTILSTGSPLKPQSYNYTYSCVKEDLLLGSITGGSDIISCFAGQNPMLPVHEGEIQSPNLGMAIECWDETGKPVIGEKGELVCISPFPSMPIYFWNDKNGEKYQKAYFHKFPGVWTHGDFCMINPVTKGIYMLGRSDGTLNPNGIRFGSSEIYNIVESFKEIQDSVCVSQYNKLQEERVVLFLKLAMDHSLTTELIERVKLAIRRELSARHVPAVILETKAIPYTINGKKVEVAVKKAICGEEVLNKDSLANPECVDFYYNIPELNGF
ncbi:acetoacetyl-CoA synthetase-like [Centruroides sculpturatus]|uniref:acetoacetyl-CoA synthetase-like n=2 Tax=Centruroides sculpturatus TaxID=218467 RepID=UPI000C6E01EC|nr:acetoacetyl-CoA synthetase-like [Centruroides sculpturatus]